MTTLARFDPVNERKSWLESWLKRFLQFEPQTSHREAQTIMLNSALNNAADCFFLGLADEVRPVLEAMIDFMVATPEPDVREYSPKTHHWRTGWDKQYSWRCTLGLCKWLSRNEAAASMFAGAVKAQWDGWEHAYKENVDVDHGEEQDALSEYLAVALNADEPAMGLKLYSAVRIPDINEFEAPLFGFGQWACQHLANGGRRDATFVARGTDMLRASLLPNFFFGADRVEPALWLKAIYWDSGVVQTPEQAFAKAYESMPGIACPDFMSRYNLRR
jgi:hypothetical protein